MKQVAIGYCLLLFAVACTGVVRYKQLAVPFKILAWSVIAIFFTTLIDEYCIVSYGPHKAVLHIQCLEEYLFYSTVYYHLFRNETIKKFIIISIVAMVIFFFINAIFLQPFFNKFPTNINTGAQVLNAVFSLLLFKQLLDYPVKVFIIKQSVFWFNTAMLFYATTIFFMIGLSNYLTEQPFAGKMVTGIWWFIDYLFHVFIGIAFLTQNKENNAANA